MAIKATEISDLIKQRIENFKSVTEARNVGTDRVGHRRHRAASTAWPMRATARCSSSRATPSAWR